MLHKWQANFVVFSYKEGVNFTIALYDEHWLHAGLLKDVTISFDTESGRLLMDGQLYCNQTLNRLNISSEELDDLKAKFDISPKDIKKETCYPKELLAKIFLPKKWWVPQDIHLALQAKRLKKFEKTHEEVDTGKFRLRYGDYVFKVPNHCHDEYFVKDTIHIVDYRKAKP